MSTPASSSVPSTSAAAKSRPPPAPPRINPPPPPPPIKPAVPVYRAKFPFEGQEGEMTLKKDDVVELIEKGDSGWWLVKKDGVEGWAPNNYLELVAPQQAVSSPPPAPPRKTPPAPKVTQTSVAADAYAKPVSVFPGMGPTNGSTTPWKRTPSTSDDTTTSSASAANVPPPLANKPKPGPPIGVKPGVAPKVGGKPPIPTAPRPTPAPPKVGGSIKPPTAPGQVDLAAAVRRTNDSYIIP